MAKLRTNVHVQDEKGTTHVFGPDSDVPPWAQKAITNEAAWDELPDLPDEEEPAGTEPARSGRGSSLDAWKTYAKGLDIEVPGDADRDAVIKLVDEHKVAANK